MGEEKERWFGGRWIVRTRRLAVKRKEYEGIRLVGERRSPHHLKISFEKRKGNGPASGSGPWLAGGAHGGKE